jgi:hypothetical protein
MRVHLSLFQTLVVACLAILALSGSAVAVKQITGKNVRDGSLSSADVRNGSLRVVDLAPSARKGTPTPKLRTGGVNASDYPAGPQSIRGGAQCEPGEIATGGGVEAPSGDGYEASAVTESMPTTSPAKPASDHESATGWQGRVEFNTTSDGTPGYIRVWVFCQPVS